MQSVKDAGLISHASQSYCSEQEIESIRQKILNAPPSREVTVEQKLQWVNELQAFDLGRFILKNRGLNGFWIDYVITHSKERSQDSKLTPMEEFFLEHAPISIATKERFQYFLKLSQEKVASNAVLASIPSGLMSELLYLDYSESNDIVLYGIDLDPLSLQHAQHNAQHRGLESYCTFVCRNAWDLRMIQKFDLVCSNGLNIYEPDDNRLISLYQQLWDALKVGGHLVISFLTPPISHPDSPWDMSQINRDDLFKQNVILQDILEVKWNRYRSEKETISFLEQAGFNDFKIYYDTARIFPTVVAIKS